MGDFNIGVGGGGGGQKNEYMFLGMKILWIFFGGHLKAGQIFGVIFMHFRIFSEGHVENGDIFGG